MLDHVNKGKLKIEKLIKLVCENLLIYLALKIKDISKKTLMLI